MNGCHLHDKTKAQGATLDYQVSLNERRHDCQRGVDGDRRDQGERGIYHAAASVRVSGGNCVGTVAAKLVCHIVGASGLEYERTIELAIVAEFRHWRYPPSKRLPRFWLCPRRRSATNGDTVSTYAWSAATGLTVVSGYNDGNHHAHLGRHAGQRLQPDVYAHADERADIAVCVSGASEGTVTIKTINDLKPDPNNATEARSAGTLNNSIQRRRCGTLGPAAATAP